MIIVRHHEKCAGSPSAAGRLTGKCDCKVAPMDDAARNKVEALVAALEGDSLVAKEDHEYLALRFDMLAEMLEHAAFMVRRGAARAARRKS